MSLHRARTRLAALSALLVAGSLGLGAGPAGAAPTPAPEPANVNALDSAVDRALGDESAGTYLDAATGRLVVTVTSDAAAERARAAGAVPQDRKSTRQNSSHPQQSRMPSSA